MQCLCDIPRPKCWTNLYSCLVQSQFWTLVGIFSHPLSVEQSCSNLFGCFSCILKEINVNCFKQQTLPSSPPCGLQKHKSSPTETLEILYLKYFEIYQHQVVCHQISGSLRILDKKAFLTDLLPRL